MALNRPDFRTISEFRRRHLAALAELFVQVLALCRRAGLVRLVLGASSVVRWAVHRGAVPGSWLAQMLARKPRMLVTTALANRTARIVWACW